MQLLRAKSEYYGDALLRSCEAYAVRNGCASIRLDVCSENAAVLRFYERHGYVYCGGVRFAFKPAGHQQYRCYDKKVE